MIMKDAGLLAAEERERGSSQARPIRSNKCFNQMLEPRKIVVEWRYKPTLAFYPKMDGLGTKYAESFPDWQRTALNLEIRDKKRHRRVFWAHRRSFFEAETPENLAEAFDTARRFIDEFCGAVGHRELTRLGVRQWFAISRDESFAALLDRFSRKFLNPNDKLVSKADGVLTDTLYAVDFDWKEGWKALFRAGPMTRKQWFESVPYETGIFQDSPAWEREPPKGTFEDYRWSFPDPLLYLDLDCYQENLGAVDVASRIADCRQRSATFVDAVIKYFLE